MHLKCKSPSKAHLIVCVFIRKRISVDATLDTSISISISILLFIHGSPSGKRPDLQGAMLKKKKKATYLFTVKGIQY